MESIRELYKIGQGPSSSHTIGPRRAAEKFHARHPEAAAYRVTLYGSLAATGEGHLTDRAIRKALAPAPAEFVWEPETVLARHPNGMCFEALKSDGEVLDSWTVFSVGGGRLDDGTTESQPPAVYEFTTMREILPWCESHGVHLWEYVEKCEGESVWEFLADIWTAMKAAVRAGLEEEGALPGPLHLQRKAAAYFIKAKSFKGSLRRRSLVFAYALAVAEHNAGGGTIVTAPTCGSSGVLPAVLYYLQSRHGFSEAKILRALATAGLIGNLVKKNASISGAEVGCQGEIGTACAMAAAATVQLFGGSVRQVEYAAEMGLEHHLGLTCDPVAGLVQVPCIERNAFAASRALDANTFAILSDGNHRVSFDRVVKTMRDTGHDLPSLYRETSTGGLAVNVRLPVRNTER
ncbi:MAG: L-serine ammonia-lyase [Bacteroidota bacterium]|jgi:L-serine dehydratase|nr:L-serine ammonia-lyase [Bacteroidota bacterium]